MEDAKELMTGNVNDEESFEDEDTIEDEPELENDSSTDEADEEEAEGKNVNIVLFNLSIVFQYFCFYF